MKRNVKETGTFVMGAETFYQKQQQSHLGLTLAQAASSISTYVWARQSCLSIGHHSLNITYLHVISHYM